MNTVHTLTAIAIAIAGLGLAGATARAAPIGPNLVQNGEFAFTNGPGQLTKTVTEAPPWHPVSWQLGFSVADQPVPDPHEYIALWDVINTTAEGHEPNPCTINCWDGLSAHGGNFDALIDNTYQAAVWQPISGLTVGKVYDVVFSYGFAEKHDFHRPSTQSMTVSLGSSSWTSPQVSIPAYGYSGWYDVTVQFTAVAKTENLTFQSWGTPVPATLYHAFPIPVLSNVSMFLDDGTGAVAKPTAIKGPMLVRAGPRLAR